MDDLQKVDKLFNPQELDEINRLAMQSNPQLAPEAFARLESYCTQYEGQVAQNNRYIEASEQEHKKTMMYVIPPLAVMAIGNVIENRVVELSGLGALFFGIVTQSKWIVARSIGFEGPYPGAKKKKEYIANILEQHPGKPQES